MTTPDFETVPPTSSGTVLAEVRQLRAAHERAAGVAMAVRALGGLAAALALAMAASALNLANQAAVDHSRVDRLEAQERDVAGRMERLIEAQTRTTAQLEQLQQTVADLRTDVRELRGDERRNEDGGRR